MFNENTEIAKAIEAAQSWIGEYWPLQAAVATNPLSGRTHESFLATAEKLQTQGVESTLPLSFYYQAYQTGRITLAAIQHAAEQLSVPQDQIQWILSQATAAKPEASTSQPPVLLISERIPCPKRGPAKSWVLQTCTEWLANYFDQGEAVWRPNGNKSLRTFWEEHHPGQIKDIEHYLKKMEIDPQYYTPYFTRILFYLRGYASLIQWLKNHPQNPWVKGSADIKTLILMWLHYEATLFSHNKINLKQIEWTEPQIHSTGISNTTLRYLWQTAYEWTKYQKLLSQLTQHTHATRNKNTRAQFIFCMDPRSEGFRRHLEQNSLFETFAAAGFFGFPFNINHSDHSLCQWQSPGLLKASQQVTCVMGMKNPLSFETPIKKTQQNPLSAFGLIEWTNVFPLFKLLFKQYLPGLYKSLLGTRQKKIRTIALSDSSFNIAQATQAGESFLKSIGLTKSFAPFIFICGHEAKADNNPLLSGLQCGACGANSGQPNAELAASALNHPEVRKELKQQGIDIPDQTLFIPACHYTTTDELVFDTPSEKRGFEQIGVAIKTAEKSLREERLQSWPSQHSSAWRKTKDWSELLPELGLANHTALIIGPRAYTRSLDLERRVFLHDYLSEEDASGEILQNILLGPGVVAQWINSYYYFSSVAPAHFGGGKKTLHNLTGNIGVVEGNGGDLKIGLPEESLRFQNQLLHEPRRLLWIIFAPKAKVNSIIEKHPILQQLVKGQWIWLQVIEKE